MPEYQCKTLDELHRSDHYPIVIERLQAMPVTREPQYTYHKADWMTFNSLTEIPHYHNDNIIIPHHNGNKCHTIIMIINAAEASIPKSTGQPFKK